MIATLVTLTFWRTKAHSMFILPLHTTTLNAWICSTSYFLKLFIFLRSSVTNWIHLFHDTYLLSSEITLFPRGIYVKCQAFARKGLDIQVDVIYHSRSFVTVVPIFLKIISQVQKYMFDYLRLNLCTIVKIKNTSKIVV